MIWTHLKKKKAILKAKQNFWSTQNCIYRALLSDIDILLLDESTANLDNYSSKKIFELLNKSNITIINSTHDQTKFPSAQGLVQIEVVEETRKIIYKKMKK